MNFWPLAPSCKSAAELGNVVIEIVVFDHAIGPEPLHQLVFTEETPVVFDKHAEGVEDFGTKRNRFARTQQAAFGNIQLKRFEMKNHNPTFTNG